MALTFEYGDKTVQEFVHLYCHGELNLEPGFQRRSVRAARDRQKLIESICSNCPIPSVWWPDGAAQRGAAVSALQFPQGEPAAEGRVIPTERNSACHG